MVNHKNSFTILFNGITDKITTDTTIVNANNNLTVKALWDTGANCCCISEDLVKLLKLNPVGKVTFYTPFTFRIPSKECIDFSK